MFTLLVLPNGKALLATPSRVTPEEMHDISNTWEAWKTGHRDLLVVGECEVRLIEDVDLSIGARKEANTMDKKPDQIRKEETPFEGVKTDLPAEEAMPDKAAAPKDEEESTTEPQTDEAKAKGW